MKISKLLGATMIAGAPGRPPYPTLHADESERDVTTPTKQGSGARATPLPASAH
jgi:hypothetical protein